MNYRIIFLVSMYLLVSGLKTSGQDILHVNRLAGKCYASNSVNRVYIPPPKEFYQNRDRKGVKINVNFSANFPSAGRNAFNYAVSILSSILPDNTSFTVNATWASLSNNTILANTGVSTYIGGSFINARNPYVYYPVALAEKIAGKSFNGSSDGDVIMNVNSKVSWYTGTDGNPGILYDLVTVVLHELCHGIGFTDSFSVSGTTGGYGLNGIPLIYDSFVEDVTGHYLTDTIYYSNGSTTLYTALTGGGIYIKGKVLTNRARLYAPSTWDSGSSISHLNENTYNGSSDALMTPFISKGEAIHSPGTILRGILGDIGWINTSIIHTPFKDTEQNLSQITFNSVVKSDTAFLKNKVGLVYSFDKFAGKDTVYMNQPQTGDTFSFQLNIPAYNTPVSYYFFVTDYFGRVYKLPSKGESSPYSFFIGTDTIKPTVNHTPPNYLLDKSPSFRISAVADDNLGIDTVYVEYKNNDGSFSTIGLFNDSLDFYSNNFDLKILGVLPDTFQYRIVAVDSSVSGNKGYSPSTDFYKVPVIKILDVVAAYTTDFSNNSTDFVNNGFSITTPSGFSDPALHSKHPYESPEKDGDSIVYTSVLRYPIKVDPSGIAISYMEIVLVEPGESGSVYGSPDFYDYVVVEASKNFGKTWFPMADGYDSRITLSFLGDYTGSMDGINSTYLGTASMFHKHTIEVNTFTSFSKTDTLLIRFRLFSDPYAHGWGWAVDDLSIKSVAADVPKTEFTGTTLFPNPGSGLMKVYQAESSGKETDYQVLNIMGMKVKTGKVIPGTSGFIDISDQPPGIYIIVVGTGSSVISFKYTKLR